MSYLKVSTSFRDSMSMLTDAEKGKLFDFMLVYAENGKEPTEFTADERLLQFVWKTAKQDIDHFAKKLMKLQANGQKGGNARSKSKQKIANSSKNEICYNLLDNELANSEFATQNSSKSKQNDDLLHGIENNNTNSNSTIYNNIYNNIYNRRDKLDHPLFDKFWLVYPRHVNKQAAKKAFEKINPNEELLGIMLNAIEKQKQSAQWNENGGQYIPHPATWLNGHRWEDEVMPGTQSVQKKVVVAQDYTQRDYADEDEEAFNRMLQTLGG